jgi:hypothetical protein
MRLNNQELHDFFVEKEILALYHANTVGTSITYFSNGGIMSRGLVEKNGLFQTKQSSDDIDKVLDVWNDVFIDTTDLHSYFRRENHYGPILFEFDIDLIRDESLEIWITKNNPIYWSQDTPLEERYFQNMDELRLRWDSIQRQRKMITIRYAQAPIPFNFVRRVLVDDPRVTIPEGNINIHIFNAMYNRIKPIINDTHPLKGKFMTRACGSCWCTSNYLNQRSIPELKRLFLN